MGEYVKHNSKEVKIGTMYNLYYATYPKYLKALQEGSLRQSPGSSPLDEYIKPELGFRFRFPFPDEDTLAFGDIGEHDFKRGIPVKLTREDSRLLRISPENASLAPGGTIEIVGQILSSPEKSGNLIAQVVIRDPATDNYYRLNEGESARTLLKNIVNNHVVKGANAADRDFYGQIASRLAEGYGLPIPQEMWQKAAKNKISEKKSGRRQGI